MLHLLICSFISPFFVYISQSSRHTFCKTYTRDQDVIILHLRVCIHQFIIKFPLIGWRVVLTLTLLKKGIVQACWEEPNVVMKQNEKTENGRRKKVQWGCRSSQASVSTLTAIVDKVDVLECRECEPQGPQIHYNVTKLGRREGKVFGTHGGARGVGASRP